MRLALKSRKLIIDDVSEEWLARLEKQSSESKKSKVKMKVEVF